MERVRIIPDPDGDRIEALLERVTVLERALEWFSQLETDTGLVQTGYVRSKAQAALDG